MSRLNVRYASRNIMSEECFKLFNAHVALVQPFDICLPKHNLFWHLLYNSELQGNPECYSNWMDETLNKLLKCVCKHATHGNHVFESSVLLRMQELLSGEYAPNKIETRWEC